MRSKAVKPHNQLILEHGKPLIFGKNRDKGIRLSRNMVPEVVKLGNGITESDLLVHDETNRAMGYFLSRLTPPEFPTPIGVFRAIERPTYEEGMAAQIQAARKRQGEGDLDALLNRGDTWVVS